MAGLDDLATNSAIANRQLGSIQNTLLGVFPRVFGTFTLAAAATTTVTQPAVKANSIILWMPTDASAGTLQGSAKSLYVSTITPGASFVVSTASGGSAAGTETFNYVIYSPV